MSNDTHSAMVESAFTAQKATWLHPPLLAKSLASSVREAVKTAGFPVPRTEGEGNGWWLRNEAREVALESSVCFEDGQARRSQQIVLRGQARLDSGAKVRWKLAAAEAWPPPH